MTIALVLALAAVFGCKKTTTQPATPQPTVTEQAQQKAEKEVTKENMGEQLEKVEKDIQEDSAEE